MSLQCPGQDKRFWKAEDIFDAPCAHCGTMVEFWKDDKARKCRVCGKLTRNPRLDLGCAQWCKFAKECLGEEATEGGVGNDDMKRRR